MIGRDLNIILQIEFLFSPVKFRYGEIVAAWVKKRPSAPGDFRCQDVQKFLKGKVRLAGCVQYNADNSRTIRFNANVSDIRL